jgi:hypothetical protein
VRTSRRPSNASPGRAESQRAAATFTVLRGRVPKCHPRCQASVERASRLCDESSSAHPFCWRGAALVGWTCPGASHRYGSVTASPQTVALMAMSYGAPKHSRQDLADRVFAAGLDCPRVGRGGSKSGARAGWVKSKSAVRLPRMRAFSRTSGRGSGRLSVFGSMRVPPRKSSSMNFR